MTADGGAGVCADCGGPLVRRPNPYLGAGLAVHQHVDLCTRCGHVFYVPVEAHHEETPPPPRRWRRLRAAFRRTGG